MMYVLDMEDVFEMMSVDVEEDFMDKTVNLKDKIIPVVIFQHGTRLMCVLEMDVVSKDPKDMEEIRVSVDAREDSVDHMVDGDKENGVVDIMNMNTSMDKVNGVNRMEMKLEEEEVIVNAKEVSLEPIVNMTKILSTVMENQVIIQMCVMDMENVSMMMFVFVMDTMDMDMDTDKNGLETIVNTKRSHQFVMVSMPIKKKCVVDTEIVPREIIVIVKQDIQVSNVKNVLLVLVFLVTRKNVMDKNVESLTGQNVTNVIEEEELDIININIKVTTTNIFGNRIFSITNTKVIIVMDIIVMEVVNTEDIVIHVT